MSCSQCNEVTFPQLMQAYMFTFHKIILWCRLLMLSNTARETDHLLEEKRTIDKQTEDLAFNNYKTFIQTANCSSDIFKDVSVMQTTSLSIPDCSLLFVINKGLDNSCPYSWKWASAVICLWFFSVCSVRIKSAGYYQTSIALLGIGLSINKEVFIQNFKCLYLTN